MKRPLTENQCTLLNYLWQFYIDNDQLPPCHVIAKHFGWSSANAAYEKLESLQEVHGLLERNSINKWKFSEEAKEDFSNGGYITRTGAVMRNLAESIVQMSAPLERAKPAEVEA